MGRADASSVLPVPKRGGRDLQDEAGMTLGTGKVAQSGDPAHGTPGEASTIEVRFDDPQYAVAPGQAVVCYDDDAVICGVWIDPATCGADRESVG